MQLYYVLSLPQIQIWTRIAKSLAGTMNQKTFTIA